MQYYWSSLIQGNVVKCHAWGIRRLVTEFSKAAKRPHIPREAAMRNLYIHAGIPLPEGGSSCFLDPIGIALRDI